MRESIKSWSFQDQPREKLVMKGKQVLSDSELLAIIIGSGSAEDTALGLAKKILSNRGSLDALGRMSLDELTQFKGIGTAKASIIMASMELGRRRQISPIHVKAKIKSSKDAFNLLGPILSDLAVEEFWIACLNRANSILSKEKISSGGIHGTVVDPKVIYAKALSKGASSIILFHNHPSGNLVPSREDLSITKKLKEAGLLLDINVLDHLIIGNGSYFSFMDEGIF